MPSGTHHPRKTGYMDRFPVIQTFLNIFGVFWSIFEKSGIFWRRSTLES